jgi:hypothetical protein
MDAKEIKEKFNQQVQEAAYYKWLASGGQTDSLTCWLEAEQEVASRWAFGHDPMQYGANYYDWGYSKDNGDYTIGFGRP